MREIVIVALIALLLCIAPVSAIDADIVHKGDDYILYTNITSTCLWDINKPMRECYHDFIIVPQEDPETKELKKVKIDTDLRYIYSKKDSKIMSTDLKYDSKIKTDITSNETYRIEFLAPSNYEEKFDFAITINGEEIIIDPSISACSTISASGYYTLTTDIPSHTSGWCFTINTNDVVLDCQNHVITGNGASYGFTVNAGITSNVTMKNCAILNVNTAIGVNENHPNEYLVDNCTLSADDTIMSYWSGYVINSNLSGTVDSAKLDDVFNSFDSYFINNTMSFTDYVIYTSQTGTANTTLYFEGNTFVNGNNTFLTKKYVFTPVYNNTWIGGVPIEIDNSGTATNPSMFFVGNRINNSASEEFLRYTLADNSDQLDLNNTVRGNYWFKEDGSGYSDYCDCTDGFCNGTFTPDSNPLFIDYIPLCDYTPIIWPDLSGSINSPLNQTYTSLPIAYDIVFNTSANGTYYINDTYIGYFNDSTNINGNLPITLEGNYTLDIYSFLVNNSEVTWNGSISFSYEIPETPSVEETNNSGLSKINTVIIVFLIILGLLIIPFDKDPKMIMVGILVIILAIIAYVMSSISWS